MEISQDVVTINGQEYVKRGAEAQKPENIDGLEYKIVRTYSAGVFAGYLKSLDGQVAVIKNARRLWFWSGAASLSQLAIDGTKKPKECKFPEPVSEITLTQVIEVLSVTKKAKESIDGVDVWKA